MSTLLFSAKYNKATDTLGEVSSTWVGKPIADNEQVFSLFAASFGSWEEARWYVYDKTRDARHVGYDNLPEAVRMAYLLIQ